MTTSTHIFDTIQKNQSTEFDTLIVISSRDMIYNTILISHKPSNDSHVSTERYTYDFITKSTCELFVNRYPSATFDVKKFHNDSISRTTVFQKLNLLDTEMFFEDVIDDHTDNDVPLDIALHEQLDDHNIDLNTAEFTFLLSLVSDYFQTEY